MQPLCNSILQYYTDIRQANENRAQLFFNQLQIDCCNVYSEKFQNMLDVVNPYFEETELQDIHNTAKDESMALVCCTHSIYSCENKTTG